MSMPAYRFTAHSTHPLARSFSASTASPLAVARLALVLALVSAAAKFAFRGSLALVAGSLLAGCLVCPIETTESVTLLPSLGIQLSRTTRSVLAPLKLAASTTLIPLERVKRVVIAEGLQGAAVQAYLAIVESPVGAEPPKVHVAFPGTLPALRDLQVVWESAQGLLTRR